MNEPCVLSLALEKEIVPVNSQVLFGTIDLNNLSPSTIRINSNGCWVQHVDFYFYRENGDYLGNCDYGKQYMLYPNGYTEAIQPNERFFVVLWLPIRLCNFLKSYYVEAFSVRCDQDQIHSC